jgi:glycosyltransferase involved in cell wall biosynthesis
LPTDSPADADLTVVILTFNEERHLERCLDSLQGLAHEVVVIDSQSTDRTREIATRRGARVLINPWINYSTQFNWGLDYGDIHTTWVMRLDADEVVSDSLRELLQARLQVFPEQVHGVTVNRRIHFLGRWIRHGGIYPRQMLRVWRRGTGRCEERWMDEHIVVSGEVVHIPADIADINLNNITWWINKHNHYASREAIDLLLQSSAANTGNEQLNRQARVTRWLKHNFYARLPIALRSFAYFFYRYVFRLGFLDGWPGFVFHALQGLWYRFLVDVKVHELQQMMAQRSQTLAEVVRTEYGHDLGPTINGGSVDK